jgi:arylsulfatase A-like enzyme
MRAIFPKHLLFPRKRGWLAIRLCLVVGLLALGAWHQPTRLQTYRSLPRKNATNLLLIVADDLSDAYLGAAGDRHGATPNIDALAREGVMFDRAFCNSPLCTPSRQSFITGLLPHAVGVTRLETPLPEGSMTLGNWLGELGYRTAAIGKMHFNSASLHGFDTRIDVGDWLDDLRRNPPQGGDHRVPWKPFIDPPAVWLNARCNDCGLPVESMQSKYFVDRAIESMSQNRGRPFAMVVSFYDPHAPFQFPREWKGRYRAGDFPAPAVSDRDREDRPQVFSSLTPGDFQGIQAAYYTSLSFLDSQVGRLIRALDDSGLGRDTLVVFLGDNGYMLGQHGRVEKNCFYEPAVRVPLILRRPGHLVGPGHISDMVELVDVFPTICHLLRVPAPPLLHGTDLAPLIERMPGARGRANVFSEFNENEEAMVRSDRYKLVVGTGRRERKDHLASGKPLAGPYQRLYDLERDPDETTDLANAPRLASTRAELLQRMYERFASSWRKRDPIPPGLGRLEAIHWCLRPRD